MNPAKVRRDHLRNLTDLPNIGPAMARDLLLPRLRAPGTAHRPEPANPLRSPLRTDRSAPGPMRAGRLRVRDQIHGRRRAKALVVLHAGAKAESAFRKIIAPRSTPDDLARQFQRARSVRDTYCSKSGNPQFQHVIPAQAGIHALNKLWKSGMDPRLRGDDAR